VTLAIIPLAFVIIVGPPIVASVLIATSRDWAKNSLAYICGAAVSATAVASITFLAAHGAKTASSDPHKANHVIDWVILALMAVLSARVFVKRKTTQPPKWMARLQGATLTLAFLLGLALLGVMPKNVLTSVSAGLHVARHGDSWWQCLPFVGVTMLLLGVPALMMLSLGKRAQTVVPAIRDWMTNNSWIVSEIVLALFGGITIHSLVSG
jgi:hypothetical protein